MGVGSSNLSGRAKSPINIGVNGPTVNLPCRTKKSAWHLHGSTQIRRNSMNATRAAACLFDLSALLSYDCKNIEHTDSRPTGLIARYKRKFGEIKVVFLILDLVQ
jgi:hypothetical protein